MNVTLLSYDSLGSTNTEALNQARQGACEGVCIVARQQTAGRGRHGRKWVSEKDAGLYFSIVLRPKMDKRYLALITLMAGIVVHETLLELGLEPDIKWVNDVLVDEKKISGILAETADTTDGLAVVVGIGINLKLSGNQPETATSIEAYLGKEVVATEKLIDALVRQFTYFYDVLTNDPARIIAEWQRRSTYFSGKAVRVKLENMTITGTTEGLEPNGALRVRTPDGILNIVQAGEVENLRTIDSRQQTVDSG